MKNKNCVQEPFSDGYTIFDKTKNRYILTEKYIADNTGINLFARLNTKGSANPQELLCKKPCLLRRYMC